MKRVASVALTILVIGAVAWFAQRQPARPAASAASPADCVQRIFQAAADGDVAAYLNCFAGPEREQLERNLRQESAESAAQSLRQTVADLKGWAILDAPGGDAAPSSCSLTVERVYAGRIDRQVMQLRREANGWHVVQVQRAEATQPAVPYGTPIWEK